MPRDDANAAQTWLTSDGDDLCPHRVRLARLACAEAHREATGRAAPQVSSGLRRRRRQACGLLHLLLSSSSSPPRPHLGRQHARTRRVRRVRASTSLWHRRWRCVEVALLDRRQWPRLGEEVFQLRRAWVLRSFLRAEPSCVAPSVCRRALRDVDARPRRIAVRAGCRRVVRLDACGTRNGAGAGAGGWNGDARNGSGKRSPPSDARKPEPPSEQSAEAQRWVVRNWLYFYRNQRQLSAVEWLGDLETAQPRARRRQCYCQRQRASRGRRRNEEEMEEAAGKAAKAATSGLRRGGKRRSSRRIEPPLSSCSGRLARRRQQRARRALPARRRSCRWRVKWKNGTTLS